MEEEHAAEQQRKHINSFLGSVGINFDLVDRPNTFRPAPPVSEYKPPVSLTAVIAEPPEDLAADLFICSTSQEHIYTVEDNDPSILWRMSDNCILNYWFYLMTQAPKRWQIQNISRAQVLHNYRSILDTILPKSLIGTSNAFSSANIPYAYFREIQVLQSGRTAMLRTIHTWQCSTQNGTTVLYSPSCTHVQQGWPFLPTEYHKLQKTTRQGGFQANRTGFYDNCQGGCTRVRH